MIQIMISLPYIYKIINKRQYFKINKQISKQLQKYKSINNNKYYLQIILINIIMKAQQKYIYRQYIHQQINKDKKQKMPKYAIIQQPIQNQTQHRQKRQQIPIYVQRLRQVLQNNKKIQNRSISQDRHLYTNNIDKNQYSPNRYQTQKSDNQQQSMICLIKNDKKQSQRLPKLKKKKKPSLRHSNIGNNDKMIIKNYMNAKLIQYKQPLYKKKKTKKTIDCIQQLSPNTNKKYYIVKKKNIPIPTSTPTYIIQDNDNNEQDQKYRKTLKQQYDDEFNQSQNKQKNGYYHILPINNIETTKYRQNNTVFPQLSSHNSSHKKNKTQNDWQYIDPLNLQTYYIKLKKIGNKTSNMLKIQHNRQKIKTIFPQIPTKDNIPNFIKNYVPQFEEIKIQLLIKYDNFQIIQQMYYGVNQFYFGQTKDNQKCGYGIFITQKNLFQGIWNNNQKIKGIQKIQYGKYNGQFQNGKRSGKGQFFWNNGEYYQGEWKDGKKHGSGYWKSNKGQSYIGQWNYGQVSGYGVHTMKSGQKYQGEFANFLKHGYGRQIFPNGDIYEGRFVNGQPLGKGKYLWKSGTLYQGDFVQGFREGKGMLTAPNRLQFDGTFKHDKITGIGRLKMTNGDVYNGMFENNKKHGHGVMDLKSEKKIIKGIWAENCLIKQEG